MIAEFRDQGVNGAASVPAPGPAKSQLRKSVEAADLGDEFLLESAAEVFEPICLDQKSCRPADDFNREGLGIEVDFSLPAERVTRSLDRIIEWRGSPQVIRVDNGPEYISGQLLRWAGDRGIAIQHIQPGKPQQNAYVERYNRTVRHEWLDQYMFASIKEVQDYSTGWLWTYNNDRPNMGLGGITPAQKLKLQTAA